LGSISGRSSSSRSIIIINSNGSRHDFDSGARARAASEAVAADVTHGAC
jgi:hypothetical protein